MKKQRKYHLCNRADRRILFQSLFLVVGVRLGLWLLPFRLLYRILLKLESAPFSQSADPAIIDQISWAVGTVSRFVPRATCLTQAMAAKVIFCRKKQPAVLRIGVTKDSRGALLAHAWIETNGKIVIGGTESTVERYTELPPFEGKV